jgi:glycosyltransferase involved in cell wall biosynthesis
MKIALLASLRFHTHTGARTKTKKVYDLLSEYHNVDLLNLNITNTEPLPENFTGKDFSCADNRLPGTLRESIVAGRLLAHFSDQDYDIIWSYQGWQHTLLIAWAASRMYGIPLIVGINDQRSAKGLKGHIVNSWMRNYILKSADTLALESETLTSEIDNLEIDSDHWLVTPSGIDINSFHRPQVPKRDSPTVFYVGRAKDIDLLFEATPFIAEEFPQIEVRIAGVEATDFPEVTDNKITFLGYVPDNVLREEMNAAHVCVIPYKQSETAGRPQKLLEYMAAEKCIVATDLPFNTQMLEDGRNGIVVDPDPEAFAAGVRDAIRNPEKRQRLATQAHRDVIEQFSMEAMQTKLDAAINQALENHNKKS